MGNELCKRNSVIRVLSGERKLMHSALNMAEPEANFRSHEETDNAKLLNCSYSGAKA
ncbi:hypothetical protein A2U01_0029750, partial [Trifolium medium]|nr:hypothetical protein [Trifolium medium]